MEANKPEPEPGDGRAVGGEEGAEGPGGGSPDPLLCHCVPRTGSEGFGCPPAASSSARVLPPFPCQSPAPRHTRQCSLGERCCSGRASSVRSHTRAQASRAFHGQPGHHQPVLPACATPQEELPLARGHGTAAPQPGLPCPAGHHPAGAGCSLMPGQNWSLSHPVPSRVTGAHTEQPLGTGDPFHTPSIPLCCGTPPTPRTPGTPHTKDIPWAFLCSRLYSAPLRPRASLHPPEHPCILPSIPASSPGFPASSSGFPAAPGPCIPPEHPPASSRHRSPPRHPTFLRGAGILRPRASPAPPALTGRCGVTAGTAGSGHGHGHRHGHEHGHRNGHGRRRRRS